MAGSTTKTVQVPYWRNGFPTNGQAKELPSAAWDRLWRDVPRDKLLSAKQGRVTPVTGNSRICHHPVLWDLYPSARYPTSHIIKKVYPHE